ncbi:MAG: 2-C-methyl-D-erythritol 2,4-cyclodiphosphate synthase, partial [Clostridia bacterium]|nr:2-C-methyl-D-erythritol 2,4-cyclodiphosphate synthase [Clostridia bacterium]
MRIGHGYDVHRTEVGKRLVMGGVTIPSDFGLKAHSDGDVLIHALADAILGAAGLR